MKIGKKLNNYRSKNGTILFVYELKGSEQEIKDYVKHKVDNGYGEEPIFHSPSPLDPGTAVSMNYNKTRYVAQADLETEYKQVRIENAIAREYVRATASRSAILNVEEPAEMED